jgi:hypothetical protein
LCGHKVKQSRDRACNYAKLRGAIGERGRPHGRELNCGGVKMKRLDVCGGFMFVCFIHHPPSPLPSPLHPPSPSMTTQYIAHV